MPELSREEFEKLRDMTAKLVQKPRDPKNPGLTEAKMYVMFPDALAALVESYKLGYAAASGEALRWIPTVSAKDFYYNGYEFHVNEVSAVRAKMYEFAEAYAKFCAAAPDSRPSTEEK